MVCLALGLRLWSEGCLNIADANQVNNPEHVKGETARNEGAKDRGKKKKHTSDFSSGTKGSRANEEAKRRGGVNLQAELVREEGGEGGEERPLEYGQGVLHLGVRKAVW